MGGNDSDGLRGDFGCGGTEVVELSDAVVGGGLEGHGGIYGVGLFGESARTSFEAFGYVLGGGDKQFGCCCGGGDNARVGEGGVLGVIEVVSIEGADLGGGGRVSLHISERSESICGRENSCAKDISPRENLGYWVS